MSKNGRNSPAAEERKERNPHPIEEQFQVLYDDFRPNKCIYVCWQPSNNM